MNYILFSIIFQSTIERISDRLHNIISCGFHNIFMSHPRFSLYCEVACGWLNHELSAFPFYSVFQGSKGVEQLSAEWEVCV